MYICIKVIAIRAKARPLRWSGSFLKIVNCKVNEYEQIFQHVKFINHYIPHSTKRSRNVLCYVGYIYLSKPDHGVDRGYSKNYRNIYKKVVKINEYVLS